MNNETNNKTIPPPGTYRPKLAFFHANPRGTGCGATLELYPAHDDIDGFIMLRVMNQMTVGNRQGPNPTFARFDCENRICVKLDFNDLCAMLQVLRGECETINGDHGLYHRTAKASTKIQLRHQVDPVSGYSLELYRTPAGGGEESHAHLLLSSAEALGLCESIAGVMYLVSFGIPMLEPQDTSECRVPAGEARDVAA